MKLKGLSDKAMKRIGSKVRSFGAGDMGGGDESVILDIIDSMPGISGDGIVEKVQSIYMSDGATPPESLEIFNILDLLQEEETVFFDVEDDAFYRRD